MTLLPLLAPVSPLTVGITGLLVAVGLIGSVVAGGLVGLPVSTQNITNVTLSSSVYCKCC